MAMLQVGGTLSNATIRITPRVSWWITAQHLLSASSMATNLSPVVENKDKEAVKFPTQEKIRLINNKSHSLITAAFRSLLKSPQVNSKTNKLLEKINSATNIDEILDISYHSDFNQQSASSLIYVLYNWITTGKIKISEIENDKRYFKVCKVLGITNNRDMVKQKHVKNMENIVSSIDGILQNEKTKQEIEKLNIDEMIKVLSALAIKQKRSVPLLQSITNKLITENKNCNIKHVADIFYSMAVLNFYNETLMKKASAHLCEIIPKNKGTAVIGSLLTSIGMLRYRNEPLLDVFSKWIVENQSIIRPQEINSLLMTLAYLGYIPKNFDEIFQNIIRPLQESDMRQSSEWLDNIWALTILNQATNEHYESVLNNGFLNRLNILDISTSKALKMLNINAAARLTPDYKGPLLLENSTIFNTQIMKTKEKTELSNSIISGLKILLPSDSIYLNTNVNTKMGFLLDAEFCIDNKCTPFPYNTSLDSNKQVFRIGILGCAYHEFCKDSNETIGPIKFYKKLLEQEGYKTLLIPYDKITDKDKLVTRAKYINDDIKLLVQNSK